MGSGKTGKKIKAEVVPPALMVARYLSDDQARLDTLKERTDTLEGEIAEIEEEHTGDDGLRAEARSETDKLTAASVKARNLTANCCKDFAC